jgi:uncharacterized PurR-regulated membrane protein YhhQ (DUF165 family)
LFGALALSYVALAVLANWLASKWIVRVPLTPWEAPAGFYAIGAVLVIRDWLQQLRGITYALGLMVVAAAASYGIGWAAGWTSLQKIAVASVVAFTVSETIEAVGWAWLGLRLPERVAVTATVANAIDSALFLYLAGFTPLFGGPQLFLGNFTGKLEMIAVGVALTAVRRWRWPVTA